MSAARRLAPAVRAVAAAPGRAGNQSDTFLVGPDVGRHGPVDHRDRVRHAVVAVAVADVAEVDDEAVRLAPVTVERDDLAGLRRGACLDAVAVGDAIDADERQPGIEPVAEHGIRTAAFRYGDHGLVGQYLAHHDVAPCGVGLVRGDEPGDEPRRIDGDGGAVGDRGARVHQVLAALAIGHLDDARLVVQARAGDDARRQARFVGNGEPRGAARVVAAGEVAVARAGIDELDAPGGEERRSERGGVAYVGAACRVAQYAASSDIHRRAARIEDAQVADVGHVEALGQAVRDAKVEGVGAPFVAHRDGEMNDVGRIDAGDVGVSDCLVPGGDCHLERLAVGEGALAYVDVDRRPVAGWLCGRGPGKQREQGLAASSSPRLSRSTRCRGHFGLGDVRRVSARRIAPRFQAAPAGAGRARIRHHHGGRAVEQQSRLERDRPARQDRPPGAATKVQARVLAHARPSGRQHGWDLASSTGRRVRSRRPL